MVENVGDQGSDVIVRQRVVPAPTIAAADYEMLFVKDAEPLRCGRQLGFGGRSDIPHLLLSSEQHLQNSHPLGVPCSTQHPGRSLDDFQRGAVGPWTVEIRDMRSVHLRGGETDNASVFQYLHT